MKLLDTSTKAIKKAAAAVVNAVMQPAVRRSRDPFYNDLARRAEINAHSGRRLSPWLGPRRGGWLR